MNFLVITLQILILIGSVVLHELAHGVVANRLGDPTARLSGRLTLNPIAHVDLLGSVLVPAIAILSGSGMLFGWAKPVPVDPRHFVDPAKDMMWVAIAGPLMNLTIATVGSMVFRFLPFAPAFPGDGAFEFALVLVIQINVVLAAFNLLPIPPLDGSRVLAYFSSFRVRMWLDRAEPYGFAVIFGLAYFRMLTPLFVYVVQPIVGWLLIR